MKRLAMGICASMAVVSSYSELYSFYSITSNDPSGYSQFVGESQLMMEVNDIGNGQASIVFSNAGSAQSAVSRIYFDYTSDISVKLDSIHNGEGVEFTTGKSSPANLPAGKSMQFIFDSDLEVASKNPSPHRGINPSESLELIVDYEGNESIFSALGSENLRVGLHVISLGEYSESFVNTVPEPASMSMIGLGCFGSILVRNRSRRKKKKTKYGEDLNKLDARIFGKLKRRRRRKRRAPAYAYNFRKDPKHPHTLRWD